MGLLQKERLGFWGVEVSFTGGLILTALEMSYGCGGDFVSESHGLMASWVPDLSIPIVWEAIFS